MGHADGQTAADDVCVSPCLSCRYLLVGRLPLAAGGDGREAVKLWNTAVWHEVLTLPGEGTLFYFVAFPSDRQTLMARNS